MLYFIAFASFLAGICVAEYRQASKTRRYLAQLHQQQAARPNLRKGI